ncbi:hypothetical protein M1112_01925 [Candidatus Parvarchaeota archaeon]|jgi:hypothetical protein|nr:hypothetical protein [Candidatus Parvarchaeota archaeon]
MEKWNKLEELIKYNGKGGKYIDVADLDKNDLINQGYNVCDEKEYTIRTAAYIALLNPVYSDYAQNLVLKRDFEYEFKNLEKINEIIPDNSVKPVAFVRDDSVSNGYIRGYITKTGKVTNLKELIKENSMDFTSDNILKIENTLEKITDRFKKTGMYNRLPTSIFSVENIYLNEKKAVVLLNVNYLLDFSEKNEKVLDNELNKTIKYLDKIKRKNVKHSNNGRNSNAAPY